MENVLVTTWLKEDVTKSFSSHVVRRRVMKKVVSVTWLEDVAITWKEGSVVV
jgi:hypothetical protein